MNYKELSIKPEACEINEYWAYKDETDVLLNFRKGTEQLENMEIARADHVTLFCGGMAGFDGGALYFINAYARKRKKQGENVFLLSEVTAEFRRYTKYVSRVPFVCTPHLLAKDVVVQGMPIHLPSYMRMLIGEKKYLRQAVEMMKTRHPGMGEGYAEAWGYYAYNYINLLLNKIRPNKVVLWNQFYPFHRIFDSVCRERNILVSYMEYGCLPGTVCIEAKGQVGGSMVARKAWGFMKLKVDKTEIKEARNILQYLRNSGLNRNGQSGKIFKCNEMEAFVEGRPNILYCGQNDYESGMFPYTHEAKRRHSPSFKSSIEALRFLMRLAAENGWNLFWKPHPIMKSLGFGGEYDEEIAGHIVEGDINNIIDRMDVVVTIFSQSAYIALIRGTPVVMLGYSQLKGKKCTYEAFHREKIEKQIKSALDKGLTGKQKESFIKHCAQLMKYYLYDDLQEKPFLIGKGIERKYCK